MTLAAATHYHHACPGALIWENAPVSARTHRLCICALHQRVQMSWEACLPNGVQERSGWITSLPHFLSGATYLQEEVLRRCGEAALEQAIEYAQDIEDFGEEAARARYEERDLIRRFDVLLKFMEWESYFAYESLGNGSIFPLLEKRYDARSKRLIRSIQGGIIEPLEEVDITEAERSAFLRTHYPVLFADARLYASERELRELLAAQGVSALGCEGEGEPR